jgi:hypothetical protein
MKFNSYGSGTFTGTAAKWLAVDAGGNIIEEDAPTGGGGGGDVYKSGTPADNYIAVWTNDSTIEGTNGLFYDGSYLGTGDGDWITIYENNQTTYDFFKISPAFSSSSPVANIWYIGWDNSLVDADITGGLSFDNANNKVLTYGTTAFQANKLYDDDGDVGSAGQVFSSTGSGTDWITAGGNVSNTGTPVNNQVAIWTNSTTIEGDADFTFDGTSVDITGNVEGAAFLGKEQGSVSTPGSGHGIYYADTDGYGYYVNDDGTNYRLSVFQNSTYGIYASTDIGINTTAVSGVSLYVTASGTDSGAGQFVTTSSAGNSAAVVGQHTYTSGTIYGGYFTANESAGGVGVYGAGDAYDFYAGGSGTDYGTSSSIRWKNNVVPISNPLRKLSKIDGVYFDWDQEHGGKHSVGFIAEQVGEVLPEIVDYEKDSEYAIGMDYSKITPLLVEAVKAQQKQINIMYVVIGLMFVILIWKIKK